MSLKLPYYPELVRVFYSNLKIQDGTLISEVHGIPMIIDESVFFLLTQLPSQGAPFEGTIIDDWKINQVHLCRSSLLALHDQRFKHRI